MNDKGNPKIFISYSWSSTERVVELAERLMTNGIEVILDKWDLKEGQDKYAFMEQCVTEPSVDKVLIMCGKAYTEKANKREGGVGDETLIISPEVYRKVNQDKFIPIILETDSDGKPYCPAYINSRIYVDLSTEDNYELEYEQLLRNLHNKPLYRKPSIGTIPEWLENEKVDFSSIRDLLKQYRGYSGGNEAKVDFLIRKLIDETIIALLKLGRTEGQTPSEIILQQIGEMLTLRNLFIDFLEVMLSNELDISEMVKNFFEQVYNSTHDLHGKTSYYESEFEFYDYFIWEIFTCITAVLLYYERYKDINQILTNTYFLRESYHSSSITPKNFTAFCQSFKTIEEICKPKSNSPTLYTLAGDTLIKREKKPILTKDSIVNTDLLLYQMSRVFNLADNGRWPWFPHLFCYNNGHTQVIWQKLVSKSYCQKIMPLFGVETFESLKEKISICSYDGQIRYPNSWGGAPVISHSIDIEKIATLN